VARLVAFRFRAGQLASSRLPHGDATAAATRWPSRNSVRRVMLIPRTSNLVDWLLDVWPHDALSEMWLGMTVFAVLFLIATIWWDAVDCKEGLGWQLLNQLHHKILSVGVNLHHRAPNSMFSASHAVRWRTVTSKLIGIAAAAVVTVIVVSVPWQSMNQESVWSHHWWHSDLRHHGQFHHGCGRHMEGCSAAQVTGVHMTF
jgi:hypothetical protein